MGLFGYKKEIKKLWQSMNDYQLDAYTINNRILRLEYPPKFKNLQNIYFLTFVCGEKPIKTKAIIIKSEMVYSHFHERENLPPSYSYEISIEGQDKTILTSDEYLEPRNK